MKLNGVFANNEYKIIPYCIYHNCQVLAVTNPDGSCALCKDEYTNKTCAMFYLSGEKLTKHVTTIALTMLEFIEFAKEAKADYVDFCSTSSCYKSQYKIEDCSQFFKENIVKLLNENPRESEKYSFLDEENIIAKNKGEIYVMNWNKTSQVIDVEIHKFANAILEKLGVDSFDELEELVNIGKKNKIYN